MLQGYLSKSRPPYDLDVFRTDLRDSSWFWAAVIFSVSNAGIPVVHALQHRGVVGLWVYSGAVALALVAALARSLSTYRRVRSLGIDWSTLAPDSTLTHALTLLARDITWVPFQFNYLVLLASLSLDLRG